MNGNQHSSAEAPDAVIRVKGLVTRYGNRKILDGVDLEVKKGEILAIMGGSGSGKSTLLRHLLGLATPEAGSIRLLGREIAHARRKDLYAIRKQIGVAFQGGALLGELSVVENVELPLRQHTRLDDNTIRIMSRIKLQQMNMSGFEDLMPSELSGGMRKRAALARAIAMDPKLLFLDEPSAGLDPVVAVELDQLILDLRHAQQVTIVVVTHELQSAFKIADRIAIIDQGRMLITDTVEAVRNSDNQRVQDLLNRRPSAEEVDAEEVMRRLTSHYRPD
jgi:phospholipid/cholesterol/gamma-HCH transport system ATP-binding protein